MTTDEQAKAIITRQQTYRWYNRPRLTSRETTIIETYFTSKLLSTATKGNT
jgi:hypothetical protein